MARIPKTRQNLEVRCEIMRENSESTTLVGQHKPVPAQLQPVGDDLLAECVFVCLLLRLLTCPVVCVGL